MAAALRKRYPFLPPDQVVDNLIIGAGVVGMAIGRQLASAFHEKATFLVERWERPHKQIRNGDIYADLASATIKA